MENVIALTIFSNTYRLQRKKDGESSKSEKFQSCAQLRVCSQAGGNPVYPRFSQPDNSESWDDVGNASDKRRQQESRVE